MIALVWLLDFLGRLCSRGWSRFLEACGRPRDTWGNPIRVGDNIYPALPECDNSGLTLRGWREQYGIHPATIFEVVSFRGLRDPCAVVKDRVTGVEFSIPVVYFVKFPRPDNCPTLEELGLDQDFNLDLLEKALGPDGCDGLAFR